jgi:peroxiredoxin
MLLFKNSFLQLLFSVSLITISILIISRNTFVNTSVANQTYIADEKAPAFTVETLDGKSISLRDFKGKVVYISFWASWCSPCINGFKKYADLRQKLSDIGVVLLNVSIDKTETAWHQGLTTIPSLGIQTFAKQSKAQLMQEYELGSIPAYYIVNKKGNFAYLSSKPDRDIVEEFRKIVEME